MVKIPLTIEQIKSLLAWRDQHKELVRAAIIPFAECSIISENSMKIRAEWAGTGTFYSFTVTDTHGHKVLGRFVYASKTGRVRQGLPRLSDDDIIC